MLERSCDTLHIDIVDIDQSGYALRFSPYDSLTFPTVEHMENFLTCFDQQMVTISKASFIVFKTFRNIS